MSDLGIQNGLLLVERRSGLIWKAHQAWIEVIAKRGWEVNTLHRHSAQMRERGMTAAAIIDELLVIEIQTWEKLLNDGG
jgi:hypothetical protein